MSPIGPFSNPHLLGFDGIEQMLDRITKAAGDGYPPYNIERQQQDQGGELLRITLAVAGFSRDELDVTWEENQLIIRGCQQEDRSRVFLHQGIAARRFQRCFVLADGVEVMRACLRDGLLTVDLLRREPERVVRKIEISE